MSRFVLICAGLTAAGLLTTGSAGAGIMHTHNNPNTVDGDTTSLTNLNEQKADPDPDDPAKMQHQHRSTRALNGQLERNTDGEVTRSRTTGLVKNAAEGRGRRVHHVRGVGRPDVPVRWVQQRGPEGVRPRVHSGGHEPPVPVRRLPPAAGPVRPGPEAGRGGARWNTDEDGKAMRDVIEKAFQAWEAAVNGEENNVNGVPIVTRIGFENTKGDAAEIYVHLGAPGTTLGLFRPETQYLAFRFQPWDYDPSDGIAANRVDFRNVALHEIGHLLGLGHFGTDVGVNLMTGTPIRAGEAGAGIDAGSVNGVKDLYSIPKPTPGPSPLALVGLAVAAGLAFRTRRFPLPARPPTALWGIPEKVVYGWATAPAG